MRRSNGNYSLGPFILALSLSTLEGSKRETPPRKATVAAKAHVLAFSPVAGIGSDGDVVALVHVVRAHVWKGLIGSHSESSVGTHTVSFDKCFAGA